jgi:hypothetical protein
LGRSTTEKKYIMMVSREITELTHVSVIMKWVQRESLERLEGLPENLINLLAQKIYI